MVTTTVISAVAIAAGAGGVTTPVKLALNTATDRFNLELLVATTLAAAPTAASGMRRYFALHWVCSSRDFAASLATVPAVMQGNVSVRSLSLLPALLTQSVVLNDFAHGQYLYIWVEYPASPDAYAVTVNVTEHLAA